MSAPAVRLGAWAWYTALGTGIPARDRLLAGATGVAAAAELGPYGVARAARIPGEPASSPHARYLHRVALFGLQAAVEVAAGWPGDRDRLGVFTALGGLRALWGDLEVAMADQHPDGADAWARGLGKVHPYWMLRHLSNNAHALLAMSLGARGEGTTTSGPVAGATALAAAARALHTGTLDAAVVMACDTLLQPEILLEGAVHGRWRDSVPGEAAVALLLTRDEPGAPCARLSATTALRLPIAATRAGPPITPALGDTGAAGPLLAAVVLAGLSGEHHADHLGDPGPSARIRVWA